MQLEGGLVGAVGDGEYLRLHRSQPERERAGKVLGEDADEALDGAEHHAVDHHRAMLLAVRPDVGKVKALGQVHVQLDGAALPGAADGILEVEVDLRAVEGAVALVDHVFHAQIVQRALQAVGGLRPHLVRADGVLRAGGQFDVILEAKDRVDLVDEPVNALDLVADLLRGHEDVGVVLREAAHAHQPVQRAGEFVAVDKPQFAGADGQVAITPHAALVDEYAAGAVHRLDGEVLVVDLGGVHVFLIVIPVAGLLPEFAAQNHRRLDLLIAGLAVDLAPVVFQQIAQDHALGEEEGEAGALVKDVEQVELAAQLAVVALLGLLKALHIGVQILAAGEGRAVDALQHLVFLVAAPVRAGDGHQFEGLDAPRGGQMRAGAQVGETLLPVEGDNAVLGQVVDEFHLVRLVLHQFQRLFAGQLEALQFGVLLDDAAHFLFHVLEEFGREGLVHIKVVVKAVVDGRADGQLRLRAQGLDRLRQHMAGGVAQRPAAVGVVKGDKFHFAVARQRLHQRDKLAIVARHQRFLFYFLGQLFQHVQRARALGKFHFLTVDDQLHLPTS